MLQCIRPRTFLALSLAFAAATSAGSASAEVYDFTFNPVTPPGATEWWVNGVEGDRSVGRYWPGDVGFYFDGTTYTTLQHPSATAETVATDLQGDTIVGMYADSVAHGFLYSISGGTYQTFDIAGASNTNVNSIDGTRIAGTYSVGTGPTRPFFGFVHDTVSSVTTQISATSLGAVNTLIGTVHGDLAGGGFRDAGDVGRALLYDIAAATYTELLVPFSGITFSFVTGISDDYIIGDYSTADGDFSFLYDRQRDAWATITVPGAVNGSSVGNMNGNRFAANYYDENYANFGFNASVEAVPEIDPAGMGSVLALVTAALGLVERRRRASVPA